MNDLSYARCRRLAQQLCSGPSGAQARASLRPRGMTGLWRCRAPVAVQLYVAARRGLLVGLPPTGGEPTVESVDSFVLLQPPTRRQHDVPASTVLARWLHRVDRHWDLLVFIVPSMVVLLTALAIGLSGGSAQLAVLLALGVMGWVVLCLFLLAIRSGLEVFWLTERARDARDIAAPYLIHSNWTIRAVFLADGAPSTNVSPLVTAALGRAREILSLGRIPLAQDPPTRLVFVLDAVNPAPVRRSLSTYDACVLLLEDRRPSVAVIGSTAPTRPDRGDPVSPAGITVFLLTVLTLVGFAAWVIADQERAACKSGLDCTDRGLLTMGDALGWLMARMVLQQPLGGLEPVLAQTAFVGIVMPWIGLLTLGCVVMAAYRTTMWLRFAERSTVEIVEHVEAGLQPRLGIITILPLEFVAMRHLLAERAEDRLIGNTRYVLAQLPSREEQPHRVVLTKQYLAGTNYAATAVTRLLMHYPSVREVLFVGIACGVPRPDNPRYHVRLGDIVVGSHGVVAYEDLDELKDGRRLRPPAGGMSRVLAAGDQELQIEAVEGNHPWEPLLDQACTELRSFTRPDPSTDILKDDQGNVIAEHPDPEKSGHRSGRPKVQLGRIASGNRWYRSVRARDELDRELGGIAALDMESAGMATAAVDNDIGWFVIRGISDYGDATTARAWHHYAAIAAAAYARSLLAQVAPID